VRVRGAISVAVASAVALWLPATAPGTAAYQLEYSPPLVKFADPPDFDTIEDLTLSRVGSDFHFENPPAGFLVTEDPEGECDFIPAGEACPVAGVQRILVRLGGESDIARIDLGASATRVKQTLAGMDGEDRITGRAGRQRITGGTGNDVLKGGRGRDVLIGGPGNDTCRGGPGRDVVKRC
jgi:RTX calcium-binding nonapeptide repeat (4 copies)